MKADLIRESYNKIADVYLANRDKLKSGKYVHLLLKYLPKKSTVLDLGCGAGIPVDDLILKAGHQVIGIDNSSTQIKLARKNCPEGEFLVEDMSSLSPGSYQVDAVVSFYAIFHLPRTSHAKFFEVINSYLHKGGLLLVTMGDREFEGSHNLYGSPMWSSQFGTIKNRELIENAGFEIILDEIDKSGGERHQIILAEKI